MRLLLRHATNRGIGGERNRRPALARRAAGPWGGPAVKITEDVRMNATEQAISEETLKLGMEVKSKEFVESGTEVYQLTSITKSWLP